MPLSKIQAQSINLADTFAFTGTVSGVGGIVPLATVTAGSSTTVSYTHLTLPTIVSV